ncbi:peptidoglycan-recognition protein LA-like [Anopheles bellator]|uniref:peptidoglycan-recognition protein LA-like n=1 Tax=Anopheles bellator TaxID=139047 RepID=UPI00264864B2|nr:peptidoglycan-recognition protein LA-like [Anopheles bellator]
MFYYGQNNQSNLLLPNNTNSVKYERYIVYSVILLFVAAALVISCYFLYKSLPVREEPNDQGTIFGNNYVSHTIPNLGNGHMLIDRNNWGAQQGVQGKYELVPPIPYVLITHIGVHSRQCMNVHTCSIQMRTLQDAAIAEKNLQDIQSNFYLGGDGNVYVGRGWNRANAYSMRTLAICFMGDYGRYEPNEDQFSALEHLLTYGETHGLLTQDFRLVAHSQTRFTRSPGIKLYEKIIKLPRWNPCGTPGYEHCGLEIGLPKVWDLEYGKPEVSFTSNGTVEATSTVGYSNVNMFPKTSFDSEATE